METMGICLSKSRQNKSSEKKVLESPENMVYSCVGLFPKGLQELAQETKLAPEILMEELITLELQRVCQRNIEELLCENALKSGADFMEEIIYGTLSCDRGVTDEGEDN